MFDARHYGLTLGAFLMLSQTGCDTSRAEQARPPSAAAVQLIRLDDAGLPTAVASAIDTLAEQDYKVFVWSPPDNLGDAMASDWRGSLVISDPTQDAELVAAPTMLGYLPYFRTDDVASHILATESGAPIGLLVYRRDQARLILDPDEDRIADVLIQQDFSSVTTTMMVAKDRMAIVNDLLAGRNLLCHPSVTDLAGISFAGIQGSAGAGGSSALCGRSPTVSGPSALFGFGGPNLGSGPHNDRMNSMCRGVAPSFGGSDWVVDEIGDAQRAETLGKFMLNSLTSIGTGAGVGFLVGGPAGLVVGSGVSLLGILISVNVGEAEGRRINLEEAARIAEGTTIEVGPIEVEPVPSEDEEAQIEIGEIEVNPAPEPPEERNDPASEPVPDDVGPIGGASNGVNAFFDGLCTRWWENRGRYPQSVSDLEATASPVEMKCNEPVEASAGQPMLCVRETEGTMVDFRSALTLGSSCSSEKLEAGQFCDPLHIVTSRGPILAYGLGELYGIETCPVEVCRPPN